MLSLIHTMRVRVRLHQIATLRLWDATQRMGIEPILCVCVKLQTKMQKTHGVNGPLMQRIGIEPILSICVKLSMVIQCYNMMQTQTLMLVWMRLNFVDGGLLTFMGKDGS